MKEINKASKEPKKFNNVNIQTDEFSLVCKFQKDKRKTLQITERKDSGEKYSLIRRIDAKYV